MKLLKKTYQGIKGLLSGMALTLGYFLRFDKVITQQYPENRRQLKLPKRARSRIELIKNPEKGVYSCTACGLCVRACPNNSIEVERGRDPQTQKAKLERFVYHFERCTVCGLCVDACRSDALQMSSDFEMAVYDSSQLTIILNKERESTADLPPAPPATPTGTSPAPASAENPENQAAQQP
jgi:NADH-quinone oxidoreductase subunit I